MGFQCVFVGIQQQEVGLRYPLILMMAVGLMLMMDLSGSGAGCEAAPLSASSHLVQRDYTGEFWEGSHPRSKRSFSDILKGLFTSGSGSKPDTPSPNSRRPSSSGADHDSTASGDHPVEITGGGSNTDNNGDTTGDVSSSRSRPNGVRESGSGSSNTRGGDRSDGGPRTRPPAVRDSNGDAGGAGKQGLTGNKWVDLVIGAVGSSLTGGGGQTGSSGSGGDGGGGGSTSGSGGGGVGSLIVDAIAGAAVKSILGSVLG
ncbi:hypothetical protein BV898_06409 [Hypsibius exemplaris]|uniref:Uncharacterized protein n=1 Tax=Hypsibius exemplaris TaxID=2072580 RepID=A0A1W0WWR2_HYPEX|nr:hypothetical protein BV898_06409 [Hypsibius exemplaris]